MAIIDLPTGVCLIKAKKLKEGMRLYFHDSSPMIIDSVETTSNNKVLIRCGYTPGDDTASIILSYEDRTPVFQ